MKKQKIIEQLTKPYLLVIATVSVLLLIIGFSYAMFVASVEKKGVLNIVAANLYPSITSESFDEHNRVSVGAGESLQFDIVIENINSVNATFNLYYKAGSDVEVGYLEETVDNPPAAKGVVIAPYGNSGNKKTITVGIQNNGSATATVEFGSSVGLENRDLTVPDGYKALVEVIELGVTPEKCFTFASGSGTITRYLCGGNGTAAPGMPVITDVVIPDKIGGIDVVSIGYSENDCNQFEECMNGEYPFSTRGDGMGITSVVIPEGVRTIGASVFSYDQLTSVILPSTLIEIGKWAFGGNHLTTITIPENVTTIGYSAFAENQLTSVTLPSSVKKIGDRAFAYNNLTNVMIEGKSSPANFESYGDSQWGSPFYPNRGNAASYGWLEGSQCATHNEANKDNVSQYWGDGTNPCIFWGETPEDCFEFDSATGAITGWKCDGKKGTQKITSVVIPTSIGGVPVTSLVAGCSKLNNGQYGFSNWGEGYGITRVYIPEGITKIGEYFFAFNALTTVSIPKSVTKISENAFSNNPLTDVFINGKKNVSEFEKYGMSDYLVCFPDPQLYHDPMPIFDTFATSACTTHATSHKGDTGFGDNDNPCIHWEP